MVAQVLTVEASYLQKKSLAQIPKAENENIVVLIKDDTHMTSTLRSRRAGGRVRQKVYVIGFRGWGLASVLDIQ